MALLKLSGMATAISGKIGGSVFATTGNGSVMKQNSYSQQHATPLQSAQRCRIYPVTQEWRNLTLSQKEDWAADTINYPYINRVGDTAYYNGYQLHNLLNGNLNIIGQPLLSVPATYESINPEIISLVTNTSTTLRIFCDDHIPDNYYLIYATPPLFNALPPKPSDFKLLFVSYSPFVERTMILTGTYNNRFNGRVAGVYNYVYTVQINPNTGIRSINSNIVGGLVV